MQQKAWKIANSNIVSGVLSGAAAALFTHWFTKSYREQELKVLYKRIEELEQDKTLNRRDNDQLLTANAMIASQYAILNTRFDDCRYQAANSWCFWRPSEYSGKKQPSNTDVLNTPNQPTLRS